MGPVSSCDARLGGSLPHRRLVKDWEVKTAHRESMMYLAMIRLMLRRLAPARPFSNMLVER